MDIKDIGYGIAEKIKKHKKLAWICVAGFVVISYICGFFAQLKMKGEGILEEVSGNPFDCWKNFFTKDGLVAAVFLFLIFGVAIWYFKMNRKFENEDKDERGFKFAKDGLYGTARWMSDRELRQVYNVTSVNGTDGMILGEKDGKVISMKKDSRLNPHVAIFGSSGSMKTRAIVRPSIFQAIRRGESCVITDPKGELFNDTSMLFRKNGYDVKVFNLVSPENSDGWNCMSDLGGDTLLAAVLMNVIIGNTSNGKGDAFWENGEGNLLKALILYVDLNEDLSPEKKNLSTVYDMVTGKSMDELKVIFEALPANHPARAPYNLFNQSADNVKQGFILGLGTRLQILQNDAVKALISNNDIDLTAPGDHKCAYYVIMSAQDSTMQFLSSLFFSLFFIKITRFGDKLGGKLKVPVNVMLDEFCNIGKIGGSADGKDFEKIISVVRSYGIKIMMIIQSLGQLQNRYPNNLWAAIIGNCDTQLMLGCTDDMTAKYVSDRTGTVSIDVDSVKLQKKTITIAQIIPNYSETKGSGKRALLTTDEVLRFPNTELIVFTRGQNALRLNKMDFTKHPISKRMVMTDIYEYHRGMHLETEYDPVEPIVPEVTEAGKAENGQEAVADFKKKFGDWKKGVTKKNSAKDSVEEKKPGSISSIFGVTSLGGSSTTAPAPAEEKKTSLSAGDIVTAGGKTYIVSKDGELIPIMAETRDLPEKVAPEEEAPAKSNTDEYIAEDDYDDEITEEDFEDVPDSDGLSVSEKETEEAESDDESFVPSEEESGFTSDCIDIESDDDADISDEEASVNNDNGEGKAKVEPVAVDVVVDEKGKASEEETEVVSEEDVFKVETIDTEYVEPKKKPKEEKEPADEFESMDLASILRAEAKGVDVSKVDTSGFDSATEFDFGHKKSQRTFSKYNNRKNY